MKVNGHGAYRTPSIPEGIDTNLPPLESYRNRCPTCRRRWDHTMGFPRGREDFIYIRMEGGSFNRHMVMGLSLKEQIAIECVNPDPRPQVARACEKCHTLRLMAEPAPEERFPHLVMIALAIALYLAGYLMGAILPPLGLR